MNAINIIAYTDDAAQIAAVKAFLKALKIKFELSKEKENVATANNEITNPAILESIEFYEKGQVKPILINLTEIKAMTHV